MERSSEVSVATVDREKAFGQTSSKRTVLFIPLFGSYPLRPELVESLYYLYQATRDPMWLQIGKAIVFTLQNHTRVTCGYAGVADVKTGQLEDHMNSFFLAETLKYLYLLFDDGSHFVHAGEKTYLFNTEGHVLPIKLEYFKANNHSLSGKRASCQRPRTADQLKLATMDISQPFRQQKEHQDTLNMTVSPHPSVPPTEAISVEPSQGIPPLQDEQSQAEDPHSKGVRTGAHPTMACSSNIGESSSMENQLYEHPQAHGAQHVLAQAASDLHADDIADGPR